MDKSLDYAKVAHILAVCPRNRLGAVISALKKGGYEIDYSTVQEEWENRGRVTWKTLKKRKGVGKTKEWIPTTDETIILLRKAHEAGMNFARLSRETGLHRVTLYNYLWGKRTPAEDSAEIIIEALKKIYEDEGIPDNPFLDE